MQIPVSEAKGVRADLVRRAAGGEEIGYYSVRCWSPWR
jgi:hypothetical protein